MRSLFFFIPAIAIAAVFNTSCSKEEQVRDEVETSMVKISISTPGMPSDYPLGGVSTKGTGTAFNNQIEDNTVKTLEVFIFNSEGENVGELDAYKRFENPTSLSNLEMKATVGKKEIYIVANSHRANWNGVVKLSDFKEQIVDLKDENLKNFVMTGYVQKMLDPTATVSVELERVAAKVVLESLKTDFANTSYSGMSLSNIKVYLTNVHSRKHFSDGREPNIGTILNDKRLVAADTAACAMRGALADVISGTVGDAGHSVQHTFYAFENLAESETSSLRFTRLVIQADLNGKTYYYPVNVNQPYFGYVAGNGHKGIKRNTEYRISVTIKRPGATDPDATILFGTLSATVTIARWESTAIANPEF